MQSIKYRASDWDGNTVSGADLDDLAVRTANASDLATVWDIYMVGSTGISIQHLGHMIAGQLFPASA